MSRVRPQLPRAATHCEIHEQNQHELRQLDRTGVRQLKYSNFTSLVCRWTPGLFLCCLDGTGTTLSSLFCKSSVASCSSRTTWSSLSPRRAPPTRSGKLWARCWRARLWWSFLFKVRSNLKLATPPPSRQHHLDIRQRVVCSHQPWLYRILVIISSCESTQVISGADSSDFPLFWFKSDTIGDRLKTKLK